MQTLLANKAFRYSNRMLSIGDEFEASDSDAKVLITIGHARPKDQEYRTQVSRQTEPRPILRRTKA